MANDSQLGTNPPTPTTSRTWGPLRLAVPPLPQGGEGKCILSFDVEFVMAGRSAFLRTFPVNGPYTLGHFVLDAGRRLRYPSLLHPRGAGAKAEKGRLALALK